MRSRTGRRKLRIQEKASKIATLLNYSQGPLCSILGGVELTCSWMIPFFKDELFGVHDLIMCHYQIVTI